MLSSMFSESIELFVILNEMHSLNSSDKVPDFISLVSKTVGRRHLCTRLSFDITCSDYNYLFNDQCKIRSHD
jgi:hypothetical protein